MYHKEKEPFFRLRVATKKNARKSGRGAPALLSCTKRVVVNNNPRRDAAFSSDAQAR
jgi:hypothetical protein